MGLLWREDEHFEFIGKIRHYRWENVTARCNPRERRESMFCPRIMHIIHFPSPLFQNGLGLFFFFLIAKNKKVIWILMMCSPFTLASNKIVHEKSKSLCKVILQETLNKT